MKKLAFFIIGLTIIWYIFLYSRTQGVAGPCVCPEVTEDTYQGPSWPILLPETGCGDCGLPEPPSQFFHQLLLIFFPAGITFVGYVGFAGIKKLLNRNPKS